MSLIQQMREKWARKRAAKLGVLVGPRAPFYRSLTPEEKATLMVFRPKNASEEQIKEMFSRYKVSTSEMERNALVGTLGDLVYVGLAKDVKMRPGDILMSDEDLQKSLADGAVINRPGPCPVCGNEERKPETFELTCKH